MGMNIVIVGYGAMFQALAEAVLASKHNLSGVLRHDNVLFHPFIKYFRDKFRPSNDYNFILRNNLADIKAESVNSDEFRNFLKTNNVDVVITGSWSEKFSVQTINTPKIACINVHPSLLPEYRGPNPYMMTILNGESLTGVTFHLMDADYDTGAILHQKEVDILPDDTGADLKLRCCITAQKELKFLLDNFDIKIKSPKRQNEHLASYYPHINLSESILDFEKETSNQLDRRIRALTPWLKCCICYENEFFTFKDYKIYPEISDKKPSVIVKKTGNSIFIACKDGHVMGFNGLELKRPVLKYFTELYLKNIVKTGNRIS